MEHDKAISRADLLQRLAAAPIAIGAFAALSAPAAAAPTVTQKAASYQTKPNAGHKCSGCSLFAPPAACKIVEGKISPNGWCKFYAPKA